MAYDEALQALAFIRFDRLKKLDHLLRIGEKNDNFHTPHTK